MAITIRARNARSNLHYIFIGATVLAAFAAVLPIAAAVVTGSRAGSIAQTAFATAPAGNYAIVSRVENDVDIIGITPAAGGETVDVARVPHLPGFATTGAVSPDGTRLAVIAAESGSLARPEASLLIIDLATARMKRIAIEVDFLQTPVWSPDGATVVVSRSLEDGAGRIYVRFVKAEAEGGGTRALFETGPVLGAYAVGYARGALIGITIDATGSHLTRDGAVLSTISTQVTRDWRLNADGTQLAYVEASLAGGLRYVSRVAALDGSSARVLEAQGVAGQQLGAAWKPGSSTPTFGLEPSSTDASAAGSAEAQAMAGFDVPLAYSQDGVALAVTHWSGASFSAPGEASLEIITDHGRSRLDPNARFIGWAVR